MASVAAQTAQKPAGASFSKQCFSVLVLGRLPRARDNRGHARVELHSPDGFAVREAEYGVGVRVAVDEVGLDGRVSPPHLRGAG